MIKFELLKKLNFGFIRSVIYEILGGGFMVESFDGGKKVLIFVFRFLLSKKFVFFENFIYFVGLLKLVIVFFRFLVVL